MTPSDLNSLAGAVYGARWQSRLSREMGIALRTVQRWAAHGIEKPATAEGVRLFLEQRRVARIAAPPESSTDADDRDDACYDALRPAIDTAVSTAVEIGWHEAEALTATLAVTVDRMAEGAGIPATITTLRAAIDALKSRRDT